MVIRLFDETYGFEWISLVMYEASGIIRRLS
jgi:hypothetical protein